MNSEYDCYDGYYDEDSEWYDVHDYIDTDYDLHEIDPLYDYDENKIIELLDYIKELSSTAKKCPFCGGKAVLTDSIGNSDKEWYVVDCIKCGCSTPFCKTPEEALEVWNKRV